MGRIFLGDQINKLNPEFRIFLGFPKDDGSNEIVNGSEYEFPTDYDYYAFLYPKKYKKISGHNVFHDDYRKDNPYLAYSESRGEADAMGIYAKEYYQEFRSISNYYVADKPADADFHVQIRVNPEPPKYDLEPEPDPEIITVEEFEDRAIPYETIEQENSELEQGVTNIIQNGVNGIERTVYNVTYTDGVETDREIVSVEVITEPINEIVEVGTYVEPEPAPTVTFTYKEGRGFYERFRNMTTQYTNGETVTVEGEYPIDVPITFTAESGYYLYEIKIDVDGKETSFYANNENITVKELIAKDVKPNSVVTVWGYGREIPTIIHTYTEVLVNATSSMTGEVNIIEGEHTITFYANEGFIFDSIGTYNMNGKDYNFYANGTEYSLTIDVAFDLTVDLVAVPYSDTESISPFVNIYEVTRQELGELSLERFSIEHLDLHTGATSSGVDYGDMIVNLIKIPYDIPDSVVRTRQPIKLGKFVTTTMSSLLDTNRIEIKLGSVKVEGEKGNVSDYKNVRAFLYIPYADRMELPIEYVMDNKIEVTLELDLFSGDGVIVVTTQDVPVYKSMLTMSEKIPFVQLRDTDYSNKINALLYGAIEPFISLEIQDVVEQVALPTQRDVVLNSLTGYVEVDRILSIDTKASVNEQTEIVGLLQRGVEIK